MILSGTIRQSAFFLLSFVLFFPAFSYREVVENKVFTEDIRTVLLYPRGFPTKMPMLQLGSPGPLEFSFDQLGDEQRYYSYTIIQCDHAWVPTDLSPYDYLDGFTEGSIYDYNYSSGTKQAYTHFRLQLPNQDMRITKSGNYALVVYENHPSEPVITWRLMVAEPIVNIEAGVALPRNLSERDRYQEVLFNVYHKGFQISNPWQEVNAVVLQNDRWDNAVIGMKPLFFRDNEMQFNKNMACIFETSREFRRLDLRSVRFRGDGVRDIRELNASWDMYLYDDPIRVVQDGFYTESDINGKFFVDIYELKNPATEGEYIWVHFSLPFPAPLNSGDIYVVGAFNSYARTVENRMKYNFERQRYEAVILMKQGYYNYLYLYEDEKQKISTHSLTEGGYYNTEHDYTILLYHRSFGQRYDRLIGVTQINSMLNKF
jgi:hypothetical protein